ncbi:hypothetical protein [Herbaspirillum sp. alder98]|uniref:hypothetical protein n=1 Tax=Herbaspirillum sp. alder98 TaxID=2913096 RepID=UPI001CD90270|nr:hypothetical protein [Herbaspirillum sp. alder98]MCA1326941.1 hypothetical protein [Herbaspirillum sp. alder98]
MKMNIEEQACRPSGRSRTVQNLTVGRHPQSCKNANFIRRYDIFVTAASAWSDAAVFHWAAHLPDLPDRACPTYSIQQ